MSREASVENRLIDHAFRRIRHTHADENKHVIEETLQISACATTFRGIKIVRVRIVRFAGLIVIVRSWHKCRA